MEIDILIETLEKSVEKNGEKPLTNKWLLNILKQVNREVEKLDREDQVSGFDPYWD